MTIREATEAEFSAVGTKAGDLQRACYKLLLQHEADGDIPTNGRFIFYELEQIGAVPKRYAPGTKRTPAQDVSDALMRLRGNGLVPWDYIVDESREVLNPGFAANVLGALQRSAHYARIDAWDGELPPLVICESRAVKGVLTSLMYEYLAPIAATGGQCGGFLVTDIVPLLEDNDREVLYIGDHEIRGPADQIEDNTRRYLERHAGRPIQWTRIALTQAQVDADPRLSGLVIDKLDNRYRPAKAYQAVECEAIGQRALVTLVRAHLDARLPEPLAVVRAREAAQQAWAVGALGKLKMPKF